MRIEAENLQEAFQKAAEELNCSVTELDIKILQNPSAGFLGFFKKTAIIEAVKEGAHKEAKKATQAPRENGHKENGGEKKKEFKKKESSGEEQNHKSEKKKNHKNRHEHHKNHATKQNETSSANEPKVEEAQLQKEPQVKEKEQHKKEQPKKDSSKNILDHSIIDTFNKNDFYEGDEKAASSENLGSQVSTGEANLTQAVPNLAKKEKQDSRADRAQAQKPKADIDKVLPEIKQGVEKLFGGNFFTINKIDVRKFDDETVIVELDGEDAALLIGKEGYRYKAISYLLYNWISSKYGLAVRLEIAQFLQNQEAAIDQYLKGIIERVEETGKAKTKSLDGVLVKIALEKLREKFPDKYVSVKSNSDGQFVVVNDFIKK
ncbi:Jag N-terminal domain-containing protein [uncultured Campylobacter sp.]|uniref:Jag N-terminal domain-containing protein n=1 Tax=uncultured Campylobacter sp. TaxID=218934 RepID=UPI00261731C7|nr:Jag N-terminal domain-containing protein [uncultured Campylobacter sp.]